MKGKRPEILSPAGSMESLRAAVSAGCDAVYIGGSRFGARAYADNPSEEEMLDAIRYCHRYGVKLYMTVNTLLKQRELEEELYEYILPYYLEGIDAAIVQDFGVMRYLNHHFPELSIHASTQMTLTMGAGASLLKRYGVTRIVPARELDIRELQQMRQDTDLEIEVFVHGAICYSYSGRCLFSSMQGGRSGNRGRCAQPCRMAYRVTEGNTGAPGAAGFCAEGKYLLSPKENCALTMLPSLIEAGVDSFKIEGRMKRPEYTAFTTAIYRKYTEKYTELGAEDYQQYLQANQREWKEDLRRLAELYNRSGFTSGYLEGNAGVPGKGYTDRQGSDMMSPKRPKHGGVFVGKVLSAGKGQALYRVEQELHAQDIVEFRNQAFQTEYEYTLGGDYKIGEKVSARYQKGCRISPGDIVYRTRDARLMEEIKSRYMTQERKRTVSFRWEAEEGKPARLSVLLRRQGEEGGDVSFSVTGQVCQEAQRHPTSAGQIRKLLCQTGDTMFEVETCEVEMKDSLFLPVGEIKRLRREALNRLQEQLERGGKVRQTPPKDAASVSNDALFVEAEQKRHAGGGEDLSLSGESGRQFFQAGNIVSVLTVEQAEKALELPAIRNIYLRMDEMTEQELHRLILLGREAGRNLYLAMPAVFRKPVYERERKKVAKGISLFQMEQLSGFVVQNMESVVFLRDEVKAAPERIILDASLYVWNRESAAFWREQGINQMTLPLELTGKEWTGLADSGEMQAIVYGRIPLMVSAQCLRRQISGCVWPGCGQEQRKAFDSSESIGTGLKRNRGRIQMIQDEKGRKFLVQNFCSYCYNVIWQEKPLVLTAEEEYLRAQGIHRFRYDFTAETPEEMEAVLAGVMPKGEEGHFRRGAE